MPRLSQTANATPTTLRTGPPTVRLTRERLTQTPDREAARFHTILNQR